MSSDDTITAMAAARLRALRTQLLPLHRAVLDYERRQYELDRGSMGGPHQALRIILEDDFFAWLRPLASLIVQMDERLAADDPVLPADVQAFEDQTRGLLQRDLGGHVYREAYQRILQASPEVVIAHGRVFALLADNSR
jgi:hypothetical protein